MTTAKDIRRIIAEYFTGKPVVRAYLFGSYARGEADADSDVDVLVELDQTGEGVDWFLYTDMIRELSGRLGRKVDLVSVGGLSKFIAPFVHNEKLLVYER